MGAPVCGFLHIFIFGHGMYHLRKTLHKPRKYFLRDIHNCISNPAVSKYAPKALAREYPVKFDIQQYHSTNG